MECRTGHAGPNLSTFLETVLLALVVAPASVVMSHAQTPAQSSSSGSLHSSVDGTTTLEEFFEPTEAMIETRAQRMGQLKQVGLAILLFAEDHGKALPVSLKDVQPYCGPDLHLWAEANVEYRGKGNLDLSSKAPLAFDQGALLGEQGAGVLFADGRVEYEKRSTLGTLGIIDPDARFKIAWSFARCPQEDTSPMAFLNEHGRQAGRMPSGTPIFILSSEQVEQFRHSSPQSAILSSPQMTVDDRHRAQFMMANREWAILFNSGPEDPNRTSDPCLPAGQKVGPAIKVEAWCTKGDGGTVVTSAAWGIADTLPERTMPPAFPLASPPITRSRVSAVQASRLGEWVVVPRMSRDQRYFVMWQVTAPSRPTDDDQG